MDVSNGHAIPAILKMRDIFGDAIVNAVRDELTLEPMPKPYELAAERVAILPFVARSGSTYATQLLSSHPAFGTVTDWFLPRRLNRVQEKEGASTHNQVAQRILHTKTGAVFASKCTRDSLISAAFLGVIDQFLDRITFLVMDRRDKVAQAVSFHKARISGRFHSSQAQRMAVTLDDFDFDEIYRFYRRFREISGQLMSLGDAFGRPLQRFWYEDFSKDPATFLQAINQAFDLPEETGLQAKAGVEKLGDGINVQWADRFREMLAIRGLDEPIE